MFISAKLSCFLCDYLLTIIIEHLEMYNFYRPAMKKAIVCNHERRVGSSRKFCALH